MKILIKGGAGFIGSAVARRYITETQVSVLVYDKLTYAGNLASLAPIKNNAHYAFRHGDICNRRAMTEALAVFQPDIMMHLAVECHVDRSIDGPAAFIETHLVGTFTLLETVLEYWRQSP